MDSEQLSIVNEIRNKSKEAAKLCTMFSFFLKSSKTAQDNSATLFESLTSNFLSGKNVAQHLHDAHFHGYSHEFSSNVSDSTNGKKYYSVTPTASEVLIKEQMTFQDLDNNGLVWCKDFCINPYDKAAPLAVRRAQLNNKKYLKLTMMSWAEYLDTVSVHLPWKTRACK